MAEERNTERSSEEDVPQRKNLVIEDLLEQKQPFQEPPPQTTPKAPQGKEEKPGLIKRVKEGLKGMGIGKAQENLTRERGQKAARAVGGLELLKQMSEGTGEAAKETIQQQEEQQLNQMQQFRVQQLEEQLQSRLITQAQYNEYMRQMQMREMIRQRQVQQQQAIAKLGGEAGKAAIKTAGTTAGGSTALTMGFASNPIFGPLYFTAKLVKKLIKK